MRVVQDIPPFMLLDGQSGCIVGLNNVGLRRSGHSADDIADLKAAYRVIYRRGLPWKEVLDTLRRDFTSGPVAHLRDFLGGGTRGFSQDSPCAARPDAADPRGGGRSGHGPGEGRLNAADRPLNTVARSPA